MLLYALVLAASLSEAREFHFSKKANIEVLQAELRTAGLRVRGISCYGIDCVIAMPDSELGDPARIVAAHVYVDPKGARQNRIATIRRLHARLKSGQISSSERDELLRMVVEEAFSELKAPSS